MFHLLVFFLANEINARPNYRRNKATMLRVVEHLRATASASIHIFEGIVNSTLLSRVITLFNQIAPCMNEHDCNFSIVKELTYLLENCTVDGQIGAKYTPSLVNPCITNIVESVSPTDAMKVILQWKMSDLTSQVFVDTMHTSLL